MISVAYYEAMQAVMGAARTERFARLFMIPGMGHCGGGDGFPQIDTLSALMAWVERGRAPAELVADRVDDATKGSGGPDGRGGGPGRTHAIAPYAQPARPALASRPLYPFPLVARYKGAGDPGSATSWTPEMGVADPVAWYGASLLTPGYERDFAARDGSLVSR